MPGGESFPAFPLFPYCLFISACKKSLEKVAPPSFSTESKEAFFPMAIVLSLLQNVLEEGFIYGVVAMGVYITYKILDFPDLSVDGTFPLGCAVTAALITGGVNPWLSCVVAFIAGALAGCVTGLLHVRLHVTDLLSGIIVMTACWSINLLILAAHLPNPLSGNSLLQFYNQPTIFTSFPMSLLPASIYRYRVLLLSAVLALVVKLLMDAFLRTKSGMLLRATGDNPQFVTSLGRDQGSMKILGLAIGNGCTALSGAILAQQAESATVSIGTGMVVQALAAVIIGTSVFGRIRALKPTSAVLLGTILYKAVLLIAMLWLPATFLKLTMAVLFVVALLTDRVGKKKGSEVHA
jgi:putative ABC transport system permease protein